MPTTETYKTITGIIHKSPSQVEHIDKVRDVLNQKVDREPVKPCLNSTSSITDH